MPITGQVIRDALASCGAVGKQIRSFDELAAGADGALRSAPGLTAAGAAGFLATCMVESAWFRTTVEFGSGQRYAPHIGRTFIQITWPGNYLAFGQWCKAKGLIQNSERQFVDDPAWLGDYRWAWLGPVQYMDAHGLWPIANRGDFRGLSQGVNGGNGRIGTSFTPNGWAQRQKAYAVFLRAGNGLLPAGVAAAASSPAAPSGGGGAGSIPRLNEGDTGPAVRRLQEWLNRTFPAYAGIPLDLAPQRYGPATVGVIAEFQRRSGVAGGDGKNIGDRTAEALWNAGYRP